MEFYTLPPKLTAQAWIVSDSQTGQLLFSHNPHNTYEIGSLTKLMTWYMTLRYIKLGIIDYDQELELSRYASGFGGNTASIQEGDVCRISDLMHAAMISDGNEAAIQLAETIGEITSEGYRTPEGYVKAFVSEMNRFSSHITPLNTSYSNPWGLRPGNKSNTTMLALLSSCVLSEPILADIFSKRDYTCKLRNPTGQREIKWDNMHTLFEQGFSGVKSGWTNAAGPCLVARKQQDSFDITLILLSCAYPEDRAPEAVRLADWAFEQLSYE